MLPWACRAGAQRGARAVSEQLTGGGKAAALAPQDEQAIFEQATMVALQLAEAEKTRAGHVRPEGAPKPQPRGGGKDTVVRRALTTRRNSLSKINPQDLQTQASGLLLCTPPRRPSPAPRLTPRPKPRRRS